ncbi:unnamed protein product [Parnassius apollo]|uniref:(apollo) hypothetical protein n=1 Tax=Parnassius apollo TaxID=110799 RepID=A0A8S3XHH7_PARAO|nr:unnamed protein product [Parnassius apollo]
MRPKEDNLERKRRKILKPITHPLEEIVSINKNKEKENNQMGASYENDYDNFSSCTSDYYYYSDTKEELNESIFNEERDSDINVTYGTRNEERRLLMGNVPIAIKKTKDSSVDDIKNKSYVITPGLS